MVLPWSWNSLDSLEEFRQAANLCERIHWIFPLLRWNTSEEAPRNLADVSPRTHDCSARLQPGNSSKLFHLITMMKLLLQIVFLETNHSALHAVTRPGCSLSSWWSVCPLQPVYQHAERSSLAGCWQSQDSNDRHPSQGCPCRISQQECNSSIPCWLWLQITASVLHFTRIAKTSWPLWFAAKY